MSADDPLVLVPNSLGGVDVCSASDLLMALAAEDESFDEALTNAAIDMNLTTSDLPRLIAKVRAYNETGDIDAYWKEN